MRKEIENPMLFPAPDWTPEPLKLRPVDLSDWQAEFDAWNREQIQKNLKEAREK